MISIPRRRTTAILLFTVLACSAEDPAGLADLREAPEWLAPFESVIDQWRFQGTLVSWFSDRGVSVRLDDAGRMVEIGGRRRIFDLAAIARACAAVPEREWRAALDSQLGVLIDTSEELSSWKPPQWSEARARLRARLYPDGFVQAAGMTPTEVVHRIDLDGTMTCAVLDRGESALLVPSEAPGTWGVEPAEVLAAAIANTRTAIEDQLVLGERDIGDFGTLHEVTGASYYATLAALWLDRWPELIGDHGAFVAIPWRHSVLVLPFDGPRAARAVPGLYAVAREVVEAGGGAVAPTIWWRRPDGGFEHIHIEERDGQPTATPSPGLAELLRELLNR